MRLRRFPILTTLCLLSILPLKAQPNKYGVPLITNYPYNITGGSEQNWCITQDHRGVVYVGNNDKGILEYDGVEWRKIPVPDNVPVLSLVTSDDGVVYAGLSGDFGRLEPDRYGQLQFRSMADSSIQALEYVFDVWRTFSDEQFVYFCSPTYIFIYNKVDSRLSVLETPEGGFFSFLVGNILYHANFLSGLMRMEGDHFEPISGGEFYQEKNVNSIHKYDEGHLLIGTYFNGLYMFDLNSGRSDSTFVSSSLRKELKKAGIINISKDEDQILVCTESNGLYILDHEGNLTGVISKNEELEDQTISYAYTNERLKGSGPIWIAHWKGASKVEANNPFRHFTEQSGFEGLIHDIVDLDGVLYVATSQGLFFKSGTGFTEVPEVYGQIWDLEVIEPVRGRKYLLASAGLEIFILDRNRRAISMRGEVINAPANPIDLEQYGGRCILRDPKRSDVFYTGKEDLVGLQYQRGKWKEIMRVRNLKSEIIRMVQDKYGYVWITGEEGIQRVDVSVTQESDIRYYSTDKGLPANKDNVVFLDDDLKELLVGTTNGFYRYDYFFDTIQYDSAMNSVLPPGSDIQAFYRDKDHDYWFSFESETGGWTELVARKSDQGELQVVFDKPFQRLPNASVDVFHNDDDNGIWFSKADELFHFDKGFTRNDSLPFTTLIRKVVINRDSVLYFGTNFREDPHGGFAINLFQEEDTQPILKYRYNNIEFHWAAPYFEQEDKLLYSYRLVDFADEWSEWTNAKSKEFTNLKYGKYTLFVKALNVYGHESEPARYSFTISRPWYASIPAIIGYILLSGLLVYLIIKIYTRRLKQENIRLEGIIEERTAEIRKQKEELTDSIEYASRIQRALLPSEELMNEHSIDHFILFRPRDIVSGDFYWMGYKNDKLLIVAADCTGHGVPGAFMSMLGMTFLDEIVIKSEITETDRIMDTLREQLIASLEQSGRKQEEAVKDGMDLAMIAVDLKSGNIQYSGAYNPLYLVRKLKRSEKGALTKGLELDLPRGSIHDGENLLIQIMADQMPIGVSEKEMSFTATDIKDEGFNIYMFSDGFLDQFGGPQGKKFMSKNFKKLLLELQDVPLKDQGSTIEKVLLNWMGEISQIDDILVMGLRLNPQ
jgi:serine phosphatase RsbU (regulator of sigma subunit)